MPYVAKPRTGKPGFKKPYGKPGERKSGGSGRPSGPFERSGGPRFFQKKVCRFCLDQNAEIDYKDPERLRRFLTEKGKIVPRRITGNCSKHQRIMARTIKKARHAALLPFQVA